MSGRIEAIWQKLAVRGPMDPVERARLVSGKGIEGDANFGRSKRQVTVIEKEIFDRVRDELPDVEPSMRRANVMVSGIRLRESADHVLTLGDVRVRLYGETRPCERMDEQVPGLRAALADWGGGAYGVVLDDGEIAVDDQASIEAPASGDSSSTKAAQAGGG